MPQKILVTGGGGYVGSELVAELADNGHHVACIDRFSNGANLFEKKYEDKIKIIKSDIRNIDPKILDNVDVVFDLAALSKKIKSEHYDTETFEVNHKGRVQIAKLSKAAGVTQYILGSSALIYGQQAQIVDQESSVKPINAYTKANRNAEIDILPLNDDSFTTTVFRFSSIYGSSRRMRWDQSVNGMILQLYKTCKISVRGKNNKRSLLHIKDAIMACNSIITAPKEKIGGQIFNVGSEDQDYKMGNLAKEIVNIIGKECEIELNDIPDNTSYTASFKKIQEALNFEHKYSLRDGVLQIYQELKSGKLEIPPI